MRRDLEQAVSLLDGFTDESELAVLEVADAAVDHMARCRGGAGSEVSSFDQQDVDALKCEVSERRDPVDPGSDDKDARASGLTDGADFGAFR